MGDYPLQTADSHLHRALILGRMGYCFEMDQKWKEVSLSRPSCQCAPSVNPSNAMCMSWTPSAQRYFVLSLDEDSLLKPLAHCRKSKLRRWPGHTLFVESV